MRNKIILSFTFLFFILLTAYSLHIPFFWDGTFFSESAVHFFENGFANLIPQQQVDTGGFPFYPIYMAAVWKLFGKTLPISHIALLPFMLCIAYEYFKSAKRFLSESMLPFAMILLLIEPAFITQSILMGYDLFMICFFMMALNALLEGRLNFYRIALALLCLSNMRGIMLGISLLIIDIFMHYSSEKKLKAKFRNYFIAALFISAWAFYHYSKTGWFFFSPERENTHESLLPFHMIFRQLFYIGWKIADFGRIILWLFLLIGGAYFYKKQKNRALKEIMLLIFIPLLILSVFMAPLGNPIGHKYFIVVFLYLNIGTCFLLQQFKSKMIRIGFGILFCFSLISGNFWMYPERYGNGWDSSLKVLPYFQLKNEMDIFIRNENINAADIGTQFPLIADTRYSLLSDSSFYYNNVWSGPINKYNYFLYTNVINTDISDQVEEVKKKWILVKRIASGSVYIELYKWINS